MSHGHARGTTNPAQRVLLEEVERAFGGDSGARIFVQAALRAARASTLPNEPGALLDFVRAHMLVMVAGELGARGASEFLERITSALQGLPLATLFDSGVQTKPDRGQSSDVQDTESTTAHPVAVPIALHSSQRPGAVPTHDSACLLAAPPSSGVGSGRLRSARLRVALAHDDSVERAGIARHLVQAQCDVLLVDTFSALAAIDDDFPPVAVVHLGLPHMEHLLQGMLGKRAELRVVGVLTNADRGPAQRRLEAAGVQYFQLAAPDARPADLAQLVRRLASW